MGLDLKMFLLYLSVLESKKIIIGQMLKLAIWFRHLLILFLSNMLFKDKILSNQNKQLLWSPYLKILKIEIEFSRMLHIIHGFSFQEWCRVAALTHSI